MSLSIQKMYDFPQNYEYMHLPLGQINNLGNQPENFVYNIQIKRFNQLLCTV